VRTLSLLIILLCAACAKKPAAKAPTSTPPAVEPMAPEPSPTGEEPAPASTSKPAGDPCSGGE
jgi:hypothetical protein